MSISMQKFLSTPVHQGARQVALVAYRVAEAPDDGSGLPHDEKLKAIVDVYHAVHGILKGPMDSAAAEAERLWDTALSTQQKRMIAARPRRRADDRGGSHEAGSGAGAENRRSRRAQRGGAGRRGGVL